MTTDGYWNGQTETPTVAGTHGGALQLDGITLGRRAGRRTLGDPYSPRPFWDGATADTKSITNKVNAYSDNVCSLAGSYRSTFQTQKEVDFVTEGHDGDVAQNDPVHDDREPGPGSDRPDDEAVTQTHAADDVAVRVTTDTPNDGPVPDLAVEEQTTKVTEQYQLQTKQTGGADLPDAPGQTQTIRKDEQWTTAKSQYVSKTTQYVQQKTST